MFAYLSVGYELYAQRPAGSRLTGILHAGNGLFTTPHHKEPINMHRLLNSYDKHCANRYVYQSEKYPLQILFAAAGGYKDVSLDEMFNLWRIQRQIRLLPRIEAHCIDPRTNLWLRVTLLPQPNMRLLEVSFNGRLYNLEDFCVQTLRHEPYAEETHFDHWFAEKLKLFFHETISVHTILTKWSDERIAALPVGALDVKPWTAAEKAEIKRLDANDVLAKLAAQKAALTKELADLAAIQAEVTEIRRLEGLIAEARKVLREPECA
uniref:Uncharacterized protein n=1 Tax=viral metagenome TaxID=1070528 RepID=A0A6C0K1U1_9ZZZZ